MRILLVEDNAGDARLIRQYLSDGADPGYEIEIVERLDTAMAALRGASPNAVILDLSLPDSSGLDTLEAIRAAAPDVAVLVLTGSDDETVGLAALKLGAQDYLVKGRVDGGILRRALRYAIERHRTDQALRASEERYRDLVESANELICTHALDGTILSANRAATSQVGYAPEEIIGHNLRDFIPERRRPEFDAYLAAIRTQGNARGLMEVVTKTGPVRLWEFNNTLRTEGVDEPVVRGIARDVTERVRAEQAMRASEERYRHLFEMAQHGACVMEGERFVAANAAAESLFGVDPGGLVGRSPLELSPPVQPDGRSSREAATAYLDAAYEGVPQRFAWRHLRSDGSEWDAEIELGRFEAGRLHVALRDVTDRNAALARVTILNRMLRTISEINQLVVRETQRPRLFDETCRIAVEVGGFASAAIAVRDGETGVRTIATAGAESSYFDEIELRADDSPLGRGPTGTALRTGQPQVIQDLATAPQFAPWREAAMRRGFAACGAFPIAASGRVFGALKVFSSEAGVFEDEVNSLLAELASDVGFALQSIAAEAELRRTRDHLAAVIDSSPLAIFTLDPAGSVTSWNRAAEEMLGWSAAEVIGRPLPIVPPERRDEFARLRAEVLAGRPFSGVELERVRRDGSKVHLRVSTAAMRDEGDAPNAILAVAEDVSQWHRLQEQFQHAQKMEALGRLAGGIAHDFNNLLQALLGNIQLLSLEPGDVASVKRTAGEIEELVRHGSALSRQLLLFARRGFSSPKVLDLNEAVGASLALYRRLLPANIKVVTEGFTNPLVVQADPGQLEQVLSNLVVNAADAMPDGGTLTLRTGAAEGECWLEVEDSGAGIPEDVLPSIFEPFFTTKPRGQGSGLGLSVVHGIVESHGGRIEVSSHVGKGTCFRVTLPARDAPVEADLPGREEAGVTRGGGRVLVIEDTGAVRVMLVKMLERLGYTVVAVDSAEAAGLLPTEAPFDLLLTDVMLPGASGVAAARGLVERWPGLAVVLMSGYAEDDVLRRDASTGEFAFLQKPVELETLAKALEAAIGTRNVSR